MDRYLRSRQRGQVENEPNASIQHEQPPQLQELVDTSKLVPTIQHDNATEARQVTGGSVKDVDSVQENGRAYHGYKDGKYFMPNDADEQDRLDFQHAQWRLAIGALSYAPVEEPLHVLDIGTGTGIWAMEYAEEYPGSNVIGTDLSRIQPQDAAPANCVFVQDDAEDEWVFPQRFDYVHLRMMVTCFNDHRAVMAKIFDNMQPGGWIEYQDAVFSLEGIDDTVEGTYLQTWFNLAGAASQRLGRDFHVPLRYKGWLAEIGFVDVVEKPLVIPSSPWPEDRRMQELGRYSVFNTSSVARALAPRLLGQGLGMPLGDIETLIAHVQRDAADTNIHAYGTWVVVYARKPHAWETTQQAVAPPMNSTF